MSARALALVMGDIDLVRPLALAGVPCAFFGLPADPARLSRHVRVRLPWIDHWERPEELVDALLAFAAGQDAPPVLLAQTDGDLLLASRHRERLAGAFRLPLAAAGLIEDLADKARFAALAQRLELAVPPSQQLRPGADAPEDVRLRYPLVVKPLVRNAHVWGPIGEAAKARDVAAPEDLRALWPRLSEGGVAVLAQELVPGPESRIESYHAYVDAAGRVAGEFTGRKIRTRPARYGFTTALEITAQPDVAALGRETLERVGLRGPAKADFKRGPDGALHLLEINARFNLWHHAGAVAGVNLPALAYAEHTGAPAPAVNRARAGVRWALPLSDVRAARAAGVPLRRWLRWAIACETLSGVALDDPFAFLPGAFWGPVRRRL